MKNNIILLSFILMLVILGGCNKTQAETPKNTSTAKKSEIIVAAASSLTNAFTEVGVAFEKSNNCKVTFSFGSTGTLTEQIVNGAPFDVFAAANESAIESLDTKGLIISDTSKIYTLGRIGIATLKDSMISAKTMEDLLKPEIKKIAIANPDTAPYGLAAKQALVTAGLWDQLEPKMVYGKNISETLTFVTTGNAEAGLIANSLSDERTLNFNLVDAKLHEPLRQKMAVIKNTKENEISRNFVEYVNSKEGKDIMSKYGFVSEE